MLSILLKYRRSCVLALCALLGLACSHLAAVLLGSAGRARTPATVTAPPRPAAPTAPEAELGFILQHHLFDRTARSTTPVPFLLQAGEAGEAAMVQSDLELVGTVVAGSRSLAMIRSSQGLQIFHLGAELGGGKLEEIVRHQITIRNRSGVQTVLRMHDEERPARPQGSVTVGGAAAPGSAASSARAAVSGAIDRRGSVAGNSGNPLPAGEATVRPAGENRWIVARSTAEAARENIGEQLRTALIQPNLVDGRTDGFVISRIQSGTLLNQMGLQPGDVIKRVNRMPLDSPEKALQIMQQLREARQITIDLERGGTPLSLSYTIE